MQLGWTVYGHGLFDFYYHYLMYFLLIILKVGADNKLNLFQRNTDNYESGLSFDLIEKKVLIFKKFSDNNFKK